MSPQIVKFNELTEEQMEKTKRARRQAKKSIEGEFIWELENSYELSPKLSRMILQSAKEILIRKQALKEGQQEITVVKAEEKSGKIIEKMEKLRVRITVDNGIEDQTTVEEVGRKGLREARIQRITEEAMEQGGVMSQEDISRVMGISIRTVKRDIQAIKSRGIEVITRGMLHNIGREQTHKEKIIGMLLDGQTYSEIKLRMRHSVGAIKRYVESFTKVLMAEKKGIKGAKEISSVTGVSERLVGQYKEIIRAGKKDKTRRETLRELVERNSYRGDVKKSEKRRSRPREAMMIGL